MKTLGYYNGKYGELDEMTIPMNDRVCWFGDGVYDAGPCRNYKIFAIDEHIDRFYRNAGLLDMKIPVTKQELKELLEDLVAKMDTGNLFVYYQVTRGTGIRNHVYPEGTGNLWVMLKPAEISDGIKPIKLITTEDTRFLHCNIKTLNLIPSCVASEKARQAGCQEAVFYRPGGRVTECAHSNCHIIRNGTLVTAPADNLILPGIARAHLIRKCKELGIPVNETPYTLEDLYNAEEVIVTSSSNLCLHACEIDGRPVGGRQAELLETIRKALLEEFWDATKEEA
ncbi:aminotransferase class IV [Bariatricus massiliensis]|uniref:Aminotransferase class IV n=1 Tax=Bariatricus massiliensis TaxID=1745713 RepID=A0ABS8DLH3_9FIRM|nr:aminotransferase class IV [Bariatricus massiliensis]MCB7306148.1 aminotransferase class IV [Bariatricus massiliensis]MCB7376643.1 aminotransferase class IV [Bariatricus massiliensis]MCB7389301.1 aminotransferase class IV [Bariatricus massiliensis]MCB7413512.1 aminotransferase class IV [Bariatricus massiliensis]MCQ5254317.1 aminotransferase class IV [Bariatricus massiliensis]